jgi:hyperosmotically inducible periplasmic protein
MKTMLRLMVLIAVTATMGCAPAVVGGGAAVGYKAATDQRTAGTQIDDAAITTKIKASLFDDLLLKSSKIDVDTLNGVVTLTGILNSQGEIDRAVRIAKNVPQVQRVKNQLKVGSITMGEEVDDKIIGSKIKAKLIAEPGVRSLNIDVDVNKGVVTLTGITDKPEIKHKILKIVKDTSGVVRVVDNIAVSNK